MNEPVTGLILAGGASRRFGRDKAQYPLQGRPMIRHVYDTVVQVADPVFLSLRTRADSPLPDPVRVVEDAWPGKGPLAGLHAGLTQMETPWLLAVACDMPFLDKASLEALLDRRSSGGAVIAQSSDGRQQPLCACYHVSVLPALEAALRADRRALHQLLDVIDPVVTVALPDALLRNINRPSDLPAAAIDDPSS